MNNSFKIDKSLNITNPYSGKIINFSCTNQSNMLNQKNLINKDDSKKELLNDVIDNYFPSLSENSGTDESTNIKTSIIKNI